MASNNDSRSDVRKDHYNKQFIHAPQFAYPTDRADSFANEEEN